MTTTTTTYHLLAITDESITKTHLGATQKANVTFCGVRLLTEGDTRFGGKYAEGNGYSSSTDLGGVDCGACKRTAAWKIAAATGASTVSLPTYTPAPKAEAAPEAAPATGQAKPPSTRKRPSAAAKTAAEAVSGGSVIEADPVTGLPRIKPEYAARAEQAAADQAARNAG